MKFYRIKQIGENKFIPQVKLHFFDCWHGIDSIHKDQNIGFYANYLWSIKDYCEMYCICETLEQAKKVIFDYKANQKNKRKYPKYHKS